MAKLTVDGTAATDANNPEEEKKDEAAESGSIYRSMPMVANKNTV